MTRIAALLSIAALVVPASAQEAAVTLLFTVDPTATNYSIEWRTEGSDTWAPYPDDQTKVNCADDGECIAVLTGLPASGTFFFRFGVASADGTSIRYDAGAWYCGDCAPTEASPATPSATGIN